MSEAAVRQSFREQADFCERLGSPLTAAVLRLLADRLDCSAATGARVLGWEGDPRGSGDVLALRLAGGLHALARSRSCPPLSDAYARLDPTRLPPALEVALRDFDAFLLPCLDGPPQTNEVGRSAALMAGLLALAAEHPYPVELLEFGSSAGLNLNLHRYGYNLGGVAAGDPESELRLAPDWRGPPPPAAAPRVASAAGVDIAPIDLADPRARERLIAYAWPDQRERLDRLTRALAIAAAHPPRLSRGHADAWLAARLAQPQPAGIARVVAHTVVLQYVAAPERERIERALADAGARATPERPLARLSMENEVLGRPMALTLTAWPGGRTRRLAEVHPHGSWIGWLDD